MRFVFIREPEMKVKVSFTVDVAVGNEGRPVSNEQIEAAVASAIASNLPSTIAAEEWIATDGEEPSIKVLCDSEVSAKVL